MNLIDVLEEFQQILEIAKTIDNKRDMKELEKKAKPLKKNIRKIEGINVSQALLMRDYFTNLEIGSIFGDPFWLFSILMELDALQKENSETFMDADAIRVRAQLGIPSPVDDEIMRFKVKLSGFPLSQKWQLQLEQTREMMDISLPVLTYEGLAKLSPGILYIDWIGGLTPKQNTYFLGPAYENHPPKIFPLSMISSMHIPSADSKFDFGFVITASPEVSHEQLRAFRKRNEVLDYHPLPEFLVRVKIDRFKGESKDDQQLKTDAVTDFLKQHTSAKPMEIGWKIAYTRFLGTGFPPVVRGSLLPPGSKPLSPPPPSDYLPMTPSDYIQAVKEKFDEDNIISQEGFIDDIPVVYGSRWVAYERTILTGVPIPLVPTKDTVRSFCLTALGVIDNVSLERIKIFSKSSVAFAKDKLPKGEHFVVDIPVLLANDVDANARKWVEDKIEKPYNAMVAPSILDLKNGVLYYCKNAPIMLGTVYNNIRMFIERYLITEEMRWTKPKNAPKIPKCPHCGAQYRVKEGLTEVTCQNCLKVYSPE